MKMLIYNVHSELNLGFLWKELEKGKLTKNDNNFLEISRENLLSYYEKWTRDNLTKDNSLINQLMSGDL